MIIAIHFFWHLFISYGMLAWAGNSRVMATLKMSLSIKGGQLGKHCSHFSMSIKSVCYISTTTFSSELYSWFMHLIDQEFRALLIICLGTLLCLHMSHLASHINIHLNILFLTCNIWAHFSPRPQKGKKEGGNITLCFSSCSLLFMLEIKSLCNTEKKTNYCVSWQEWILSCVDFHRWSRRWDQVMWNFHIRGLILVSWLMRSLNQSLFSVFLLFSLFLLFIDKVWR